MKEIWRKLWLPVWLVCLAGCDTGPAWRRLNVYQRLQNSDPAARLSGVLEAGQTKDTKTVPYLVDRLTDGESDVRMFAILALQKITGQTLGYRSYDTPADRDLAVARWRKWLEGRGREAPTSRRDPTTKESGQRNQQPVAGSQELGERIARGNRQSSIVNPVASRRDLPHEESAIRNPQSGGPTRA